MAGATNSRDQKTSRQISGAQYAPTSPRAGPGSLLGPAQSPGADRAGRFRSPESQGRPSAPDDADSRPRQAGGDAAKASPTSPRRAQQKPRSEGSGVAAASNSNMQLAPRHNTRRPDEPWSEETRAPKEPTHAFRKISRRNSSQPGPAPQRAKHREPRSDDGDRDGASKPSRRIKRAKIREPRSDDGQGGRTPAFGGIARRTTEHKPHILCTNNALDRRLIANGGARPLGSNHQCFQRGVGAGLHHQPEDLETFLRNFSSPYKKLVEQPLYYGDKEVPAGKIRATRPQAMQKGFGVGQMLKAKRILAERKKSR